MAGFKKYISDDYNVRRTTSDGDNYIYKSPQDSNEGRGIILKQAISEASSGDKIYVRAGTYDCNDLLKNGVYYYFEDGAVIDYTGEIDGAIFSCGSEDMIINIDGYGSFYHWNNNPNQTLGNMEVFYLAGESSGVIRCKDFYSTERACTTNFDTETLTLYCNKVSAGLKCFDGTGSGIFYLYAKEVYSDLVCFDFDGSDNSAKYYIFADFISGSDDGNKGVLVNTESYTINFYNSTIENRDVGYIASENNPGTFSNCVFICNRDDEFEYAPNLFNCRNYNNTPITSNSGVPTQLGVNQLHLTEKSSDPSNPLEGTGIIWQSDGAGSGDDGDIMIKITAGGVTKTGTLIDFSSL